jgi:hypothetical protein
LYNLTPEEERKMACTEFSFHMPSLEELAEGKNNTNCISKK